MKQFYLLLIKNAWRWGTTFVPFAWKVHYNMQATRCSHKWKEETLIYIVLTSFMLKQAMVQNMFYKRLLEDKHSAIACYLHLCLHWGGKELILLPTQSWNK